MRSQGMDQLLKCEEYSGIPKARIVTLVRRSKKLSAAAAAKCSRGGTTDGLGRFARPDRSEASLTQFYDELGKAKCPRIHLAVMDMWKPFRNAIEACALQEEILYDKFHVIRHLVRRWIKCERVSTGDLPVRTEASSRGRNTRWCRAGRT